jgi:hypothetical protein
MGKIVRSFHAEKTVAWRTRCKYAMAQLKSDFDKYVKEFSN